MQQLYTVEQLIAPYAIPSQFLRRSQHLFIIDVKGNRLPALVAVTSIYKNRGTMFTSYWLVFNWLRLLLTEMKLHLLPIDNISTVSHLPVHSPYTGTIIVILLFFVFQQSRLHKHAWQSTTFISYSLQRNIGCDFTSIIHISSRYEEEG